MADFRKQVVEKVAEIKNIVTDDSECVKVMACIADIVDAFSNQLLEISKRQVKLEERTEEVFEVLSAIEEEMIQSMDDDLLAECPYCGEEIEYEFPEDGEDFRCPNCNNVIELEEILHDECGCGCDEDCDCGCQEGHECTCNGDCHKE